MEVLDLALPGLKLIQPDLFSDERGYFFENYSKKKYKQAGLDIDFVQDNLSYSKQNTLRGLHFQSKPGQDKLVGCILGEIWDVAVDLRKASPTFMRWEAVFLNDREHKRLLIPKGFAHGFCVLSPFAQVYYKVSASYNPNTERAIRWNDSDLNIDWPVKEPILSSRDQTSPWFNEVFNNALDYR